MPHEPAQLLQGILGLGGAKNPHFEVVPEADHLQPPLLPGATQVEAPGPGHVQNVFRLGCAQEKTLLPVGDSLVEELKGRHHLGGPRRTGKQIHPTPLEPTQALIEASDSGGDSGNGEGIIGHDTELGIRALPGHLGLGLCGVFHGSSAQLSVLFGVLLRIGTRILLEVLVRFDIVPGLRILVGPQMAVRFQILHESPLAVAFPLEGGGPGTPPEWSSSEPGTTANLGSRHPESKHLFPVSGKECLISLGKTLYPPAGAGGEESLREPRETAPEKGCCLLGPLPGRPGLQLSQGPSVARAAPGRAWTRSGAVAGGGPLAPVHPTPPSHGDGDSGSGPESRHGHNPMPAGYSLHVPGIGARVLEKPLAGTNVKQLYSVRTDGGVP